MKKLYICIVLSGAFVLSNVTWASAPIKPDGSWPTQPRCVVVYTGSPTRIAENGGQNPREVYKKISINDLAGFSDDSILKGATKKRPFKLLTNSSEIDAIMKTVRAVMPQPTSNDKIEDKKPL